MASMGQQQTADADVHSDPTTLQYLQLETSIGRNEVIFSPYQQMEQKDEPNKEEKNNDIDNENKKIDFSSIDNVIFFGGDLQDFEKYMVKNRTFEYYGDFCLESVSKILRNKFPTSNILIIRPSKRNGHMSIFKNFISNIDNYAQSVPSYKNGFGSKHLIQLLRDKQLNKYINNESKLHLIGFSRGVNVLNQLIYETDSKNTNIDNRNYIKLLFDNVLSMYFLDGGNGSKHKTLPNDDMIIDNFVKKCNHR